MTNFYKVTAVFEAEGYMPRKSVVSGFYEEKAAKNFLCGGNWDYLPKLINALAGHFCFSLRGDKGNRVLEVGNSGELSEQEHPDVIFMASVTFAKEEVSLETAMNMADEDDLALAFLMERGFEPWRMLE